MSNSEDVLDFLNSLPESKFEGTDNIKTQSTSTGNKEDELFDFLDQVAQHEQQKPKKKLVPKKAKEEEEETKEAAGGGGGKKDGCGDDYDETTDLTTGNSSSDTNDDRTMNEKEDDIQEKRHERRDKENENEQAQAQAQDSGSESESESVNPIASLSSWWNREGGQKVTNLWGTITSNAEKLSEQTYQLASQTTNQINVKSKHLDSEEILGTKLNNLFLNISNSIKSGLIDNDADEVLNILIVSDLYNINYLERIVLTNFNSTMDQVEGRINVSVHNFNHHEDETGDETARAVKLNMFYGKLIDGEKLAMANLENAIKEYKKVAKSQEEKKRNAEKEKDDDGKDSDVASEQTILKSNIFISIQPISVSKSDKADNFADSQTVIECNNSDSFSFTLILYDITNNISIVTRTQPFPLRWAQWIDGETLKREGATDNDDNVDPKEWVKDWIKQGLKLGVGVLAQDYVIKRMGI
ncbi:hypothetical protein KGF56_001941 [Candida oxycetoniae]|uniref:Maintenance of telomere capping protein 1 n=1 Tax=Candida oxycetoniae TaxID=497107 RepID=A0AAI9SZK1_9ASCO|nr:uncharacterized protein KGF56_001941 [Candida oxycetoniae]KAI3405249.2 hypothetical protein KGF56_001941 [Candida oxycetoniae]